MMSDTCSSGLDIFPSAFGSIILKVANECTNSDLSSMKLVLMADDVFKKNVLDKLLNAQDLFIQLLHCGKISRHNTEFLIELLREINRKDLANCLVSVTDPLTSPLKAVKKNQYQESTKKCTGKTAVEQEEELFNSTKTLKTESEDESDMACSQESMSDDDKISMMMKNSNSEEFVKMDI